jgi:microcompartment protein CcmK/EutM
MKFAKVIGQVVATRKEDNIQGLKLAVIRYLDAQLAETKHSAVCTDAVKAKTGDVVLVCSSSSARFTKVTRTACTDNTIVGIVDTISGGKKDWYHTK